LSAGEIPESLKAYLETFNNGKSQKIEDRWFTPDKGYHVIGSMISTTFIGQVSIRGFDNSVTKSKAIGAGTTFVLGISKEIYDSSRPNNYFSWKDLTANGVGILIGIIILGLK
jgi:uncharacterized protein YfiM (DUF2279 family)